MENRLIEKMIDKNVVLDWADLIKSTEGDNPEKQYNFSVKKNQYSIDAEILISYIYNKLHLENPQCYPILQNNKYGVVYENLIQDNEKTVNNVISNHDDNACAEITLSYLNKLKGDDYKLETIEDALTSRVLTESAKKKYIKMSYSDVAFKIYDRLPSNIICKNASNKILDFIFLKFDFPCFVIRYEDMLWGNEFLNGVKNRDETNWAYKNNFNNCDFKGVISKKELFDMIASVDVFECAHEIKDKYNYSISSKFIQFVDSCIKQHLSEYNNYI